MSKRDKYTPDYSKLYPGVTITPAVMRVLRQTDRKMQYFELDLKSERKRENKKKHTVTITPAREDSLDRLIEENSKHCKLGEASPEDVTVTRDEMERLYLAIRRLDADEQSLIHALFFDGKTERQYAEILGISQRAVSKRWQKARLKIKKMME